MSLKVLLADDSMTAQNMGKKILAESGYDVTTVSNGAAAVKKIAEVKPDVVILDIYMPGYTGLEVCERVRANLDTANLPVLLTVGKMEPYRAEDGAKVRADGVIVKPFEATDLLAVVKKMAEKAAAAALQVVPEAEMAPTEEETEEPEQTMPAAVEIPSEMADSPALVMDEFSTAPGEVSEVKPPIEWAPAPEMGVEQSAESVAPEQNLAEIPWSFDETATPSAPQSEVAPAVKSEASTDLEFTAGPQVGNIEVRPADGWEGTLQTPSSEVQITTDPALTSPQEITEFVTSFGTANQEPVAEESGEVIAELPTIETPTDSAWDGWAQAEEAAGPGEPLETSSEPAGEAEADFHDPAHEPMQEATPVIEDFEAKVAAAMAGFSVDPHSEPAIEHHETSPAEALASPNVDDFEAKVAAAMSGFATEPEAVHGMVEEAHAQPAEIEAVADDFEARVAAAMSGFATEPVETEAIAESHAEPAVEAHAYAPVEESYPEANSTPAPAEDDFDARLARALSAFDTAPEVSSPEASFHEESTEIAEPAAVAHPEIPAVDLNETMVLPHEAILSLEEEMKRALATDSLNANDTAELPSWDLRVEPAPQPEIAAIETHAVVPPTTISEPETVHPAESAPPQLPEQAAAAFAAAAEPVEATKPNSDRFADAVQRAIERLKPQLIAEIVKELKGE